MAHYLITVRSAHRADTPEQLYLIDGDLQPADVQRLAATLLHDPVVQTAAWCSLDTLEPTTPPFGTQWAEVAYKPGVTDNEAESILIGAGHLGTPLRSAKTLRRWAVADSNNAHGLYNPLIQNALIHNGDASQQAEWYAALLQTPQPVAPHIATVPLADADDATLQQISRAGVLALDLAEMQAIQAYFRREKRDPTDGELETLAQTWSEHCSHKTFKARVVYRTAAPSHDIDPELYPALHMLDSQPTIEINSLIKTFLMVATDEVLAQRDDEWVLSAFVDNAGIIAFGDDHEISIKVETHNHPSALEPFGGANTGVGGVVRDVLGVSALPIANTDVLCFGPLDTPDEQVQTSVLPPRTVAAGVVAGVRDYGNKLGIPTVNGAVLYEPGYTANPLVFCGTVGLAPRGKNPHNLQPGDAVVVMGGRTGRDGIHGATFSSEELTHTTAQDVGSAVQIGDPITEKKVLDVLMQARDQGLYSAITDCGAGGLSSAVGEMGAETGVRVALDNVPLKYAGLLPWEIWLSEAQERMVLAVPQQHVAALLALCDSEDVEATVIGAFTGDGRLTVTHADATVVDLDVHFLHDGRPQRLLEAEWSAAGQDAANEPAETSLLDALTTLLAHPNIASKEQIIRTYDHEVGGRTVIKPLVGVRRDGPGDAAVLQPLANSNQGLALGSGVNPRYGERDPYWMALACIDEALRNVVAVGGDPAKTAVLDNFCWGDPRLPDRMAGLVRAAAGCYDAARVYGTPFISGKDSLNNEYRDADGNRHAIPPTLLITALAHVPDIRQSITMDLKGAGNYLYLVGTTKAELAGAHYAGTNGAGSVPQVDLAQAPRILAALHGAIRAGLVRACHDLSEGGLGVAAAEMAFAGGFGLDLDLAHVPQTGALDNATLLFSESPTRLLVEVTAESAAAFEQALDGLPCARIGTVTDQTVVQVIGTNGEVVVRAALDELQNAWQQTIVV